MTDRDELGLLRAELAHKEQQLQRLRCEMDAALAAQNQVVALVAREQVQRVATGSYLESLNEQQIRQLRQDLARLGEANERLGSEAAELRERNRLLSKAMLARDREIARLRSELAAMPDATARLAELQRHHERLTAEARELDRQLQATRRANLALVRQASPAFRDEVARLDERLQTALAEAAELRLDLEEADEARRDKAAALEKVTERCHRQDLRLADLQARLAAAEERLTEREAVLEAERSARADWEAARASDRARIVALEAEQDRLVDAAGALQEIAEAYRAAAEARSAELQELRQRLARREARANMPVVVVRPLFPGDAVAPPRL